MRNLLKRWWFWGGVVLLGTLLAGVLLTALVPSAFKARSSRLYAGMAEEDLHELIFRPDGDNEFMPLLEPVGDEMTFYGWREGPNWVFVTVRDGKVSSWDIQKASVWEIAKWRCEQWRNKLGL